MATKSDLDAIRRAAIRSTERAGTYFKLALFAAVLFEAVGLGGLMLLTDFKDRLHQLLLVQTVLVYGTLAMGLLAVGALVRLGTLRVLSALDPASDSD